MGRRLRAVVLSAGAWSRSSHLPALASDPRVDIVAISSPNDAIRTELRAEYPTASVLTTWQEALLHAPDVAVVSSPPVGHVDQVLGAAASGAHVLVEKPFALNVRSGVQMLDACRSADRSLLVGFGWPTAPIFQLAQRVISGGRLGPIEHITSHLAVQVREILTGGTDGGWGGHSASENTTYSDATVSGGGVIVVSMSHQIALLSWLLGTRIETVLALTHLEAGMDLHAAVVARLSSGAQASLSCAATHPYSARPQWTFQIYGQRGQIHIDSSADLYRFVDDAGNVETVSGAMASGDYDPSATTRALVECALGGRVPSGMTGELGLHTVAVAEAMYTSSQSGVMERVHRTDAFS